MPIFGNTTKPKNTMKPKHPSSMLCYVAIAVGFLIFISCQTESGLDANSGAGGNNGSDNDPGNAFNADEISGFLVLDGATKISGALPTAPDNQLKINVKDTIYTVKGFPFGARVVVRHNGLYDINGFYIGVSNSSFYYDVPVVVTEAQDSTDVVYINLGDTDGLYWDEFSIIILPHGSDGSPWDKFIKVVKIEDPKEDAACAITVPTNFSLDLVQWEWYYSINTNYPNEVLFEAPNLKKISQYQTGGCCNEDGTNSTVANDPYCFSKFSDGTPNPKWRTLDVKHSFMWAYDVLYLYDDGTFRQANTSLQTNYRPSLSDFCNNKAAYDYDHNTFVKFGTHDFTPGADFLKITYNITDPPVFGKNIYGGELLYSSHNMLISFGNESEKWYFKYQRPSDGVSVTELTLGGWD